MTTPTLDSFFNAGGVKSVSWKDKPIGTTVTGTIKTVHPPQQQIDPATNDPVFNKKTGQPKMQVRIDLATDERDPSNDEDDGVRALYVKGWLVGAIGDALRKAGVSGSPEVGGKLTVTLTAREPNPTNPNLNPTNKFSASYTPPSAAATQQFFGGGTAAAPPAPVRPAAISEAAWSAMDDATKRNVAATMGVLNSDDKPPF